MQARQMIIQRIFADMTCMKYEIHWLIQYDFSDTHGVALLTQPRGKADDGGDLVIDRHQVLEPQHACSHHRANPEPREADTSLEKLNGALAPEREERGGGQQDGGGAPEDCGGRHQGRQGDHEATDNGEGDVEGGEDVSSLGSAEGELRVDAKHGDTSAFWNFYGIYVLLSGPG